jgi:hypothetical protein
MLRFGHRRRSRVNLYRLVLVLVEGLVRWRKVVLAVEVLRLDWGCRAGTLS